MALRGAPCPGAGPTGKVLLMPEDPNAVYIMVATGTGIAPYRAFWRRQFVEDVPDYKCAPPPPPPRPRCAQLKHPTAPLKAQQLP